MKKILFVTWDGPQVAYLEGLFLPIFAGLREAGWHFDILQFRWGARSETDAVAALCARHEMGYRAVRIWRRPAAIGAFATAVAGGRQVRRAVKEFGSDIVMPRSLMPAIAVLAAGGAGLRPVLFDADGLAADERVDVAGLSPSSPVYRILRDVEAQTVRVSRSVIVRSERAAQILADRGGPTVSRDLFHVVANGRDTALFHPGDAEARKATRAELGIAGDAPLLVYAGSIGPQYRFDDVRALCAAVARLRPDARLLILTGSPDEARAELDGCAPLSPIVMRAAPGAVSRYLAAADVGLAFRSRAFSMQAVAPVKLSEYLLSGLPAVGTPGIGDTGPAEAAGLLLPDHEGPERAARWLVEEILPERERYRDEARRIGLAHFSLEKSVADYAGALEVFRR